MRNRRFYLPAGSAVAAAIVLVAFLTTATERSVVNARTIMTSFREAVHHGFRMTLDSIHVEGINVSGEVEIMMPESFTMATLVNGGIEERLSRPNAIYADLHVDIDEDSPDLPGLSMHTAVGFAPGEKWAYVQIDDVEPLVEQAGPAVLLFAPTLRAGVLVDLEGMIDDEDLFGDGPVGRCEVSIDHGEPAEAAQPAGKAAAAMASNKDGLTVTTDVEIAGLSALGDENLEQLIARFITGDLTPAEFEEMTGNLEELAGELTIVEVEPGLHVMTARNLATAIENSGQDVEPWLAGVVVEVGYREGAGVEWFEVSNIGDTAGIVRLEFVDQVGGPRRIQRDMFNEEGTTVILNAADLMNMAQANVNITSD